MATDITRFDQLALAQPVLDAIRELGLRGAIPDSGRRDSTASRRPRSPRTGPDRNRKDRRLCPSSAEPSRSHEERARKRLS